MLLEKDTLSEMLVLDEDKRYKAYDDKTGEELKQGDTLIGKLTIGVGFNITDVPMPEEVIQFWLNYEMDKYEKEIAQFDWFIGLDSVRRLVIADMCFNLGLSGLLEFKKMIGALVYHDYETAADEMLDSKWARQVTKRADRLAYMMRTGEMHEAYLR